MMDVWEIKCKHEQEMSSPVNNSILQHNNMSSGTPACGHICSRKLNFWKRCQTLTCIVSRSTGSLHSIQDRRVHNKGLVEGGCSNTTSKSVLSSVIGCKEIKQKHLWQNPNPSSQANAYISVMNMFSTSRNLCNDRDLTRNSWNTFWFTELWNKRKVLSWAEK